jgi:putative component of toxin-antitoxin plasmid stabilization module
MALFEDLESTISSDRSSMTTKKRALKISNGNFGDHTPLDNYGCIGVNA